MGFEKEQRPVTRQDTRHHAIVSATSDQTLAGTLGIFSLESTSTGDDDGAIFTLNAPKARDEMILVAAVVAATSAPINVVASTGVTFDGTLDVLELTSSGAGCTLIALSTSRWQITGNFGATLVAAT